MQVTEYFESQERAKRTEQNSTGCVNEHTEPAGQKL